MPDRPAVAALVLAAGRGERLGGTLSKAFVRLEALTLLERSIRALATSKAVDRIVPVIAERDREAFDAMRAAMDDVPGLAAPVTGGAERQDSMAAGLASLPADIEFVAVHDAARCLVHPSDVERVVEEAIGSGAAILAARLSDTLKRVEAGRIVETPDRAAYWAAQTPQVFRRDWLTVAANVASRSGRIATDDAAVVEAEGHSVAVVEACFPNPKITRPEDLVYGRSLLEARRVS